MVGKVDDNLGADPRQETPMRPIRNRARGEDRQVISE